MKQNYGMSRDASLIIEIKPCMGRKRQLLAEAAQREIIWHAKHNYPEVGRQFAYVIGHLMREIKAEIQPLESFG
jgi:hypothetical protein